MTDGVSGVHVCVNNAFDMQRQQLHRIKDY